MVLIYLPSCAYGYSSVYPDMPTHVLQRHIKVSRHQPICVIFRHSGQGSKLEKLTSEFWKKRDQAGNFTKWQVGAFSSDVNQLPPNNQEPNHIPAVRCYLGETSTYQYGGKLGKSPLLDWFNALWQVYSEQSEDVTSARITEAQMTHNIVLLAFPDGPRHHEVEDMVHGLAREYESCKAMAIHLTSKEVTGLRQKYGVNRYPSVVIIHNTGDNGSLHEDFRVFWGQEVNRHVLRVYIEARSVPVPYLDFTGMESMLSDDPEHKFSPVLVCFYAHWAHDVHGYLNVFNDSVKAFRDEGIRLRFGVIDLVKDSSKKVSIRYLKSGYMKFVPFLVLFSKDTNSNIETEVFHIGRPYPWDLFESLSASGVSIQGLDMAGTFQKPWGHIGPDQYCGLLEGPNGTECVNWAHNMTDSDPYIRPATVVKKKVMPKMIATKEAQKEKTWHDVFDTDALEKKMEVHAGIPVVTKATWTEIIEKSHAPRHVFYKAGKWAGEVAKVSLVVYVMADCGNCRRNNQTFLDIQTAVRHIDGGAMYYVNCTAEPILCRNQKIRGFPTIVAYRGLGWLHPGVCLTKTAAARFGSSVRIDYHGVIRTEAVLDWFSRVADSAVTDLLSLNALPDFQDKNVKLVAQVAEGEEGWDYQCLRLLCEHLHPVVDCYSVTEGQSTDITGMIVNELMMERRDGASVVLMKRGVGLDVTLESTDDNRIHQFHMPHRYPLSEGKTCEDDRGRCTGLLADFILDHARLPVTTITNDLFHTATSIYKEETLPILIVMGYADNLTDSSAFYQAITEVAYEMYGRVAVMTLDAGRYSVWATQFVPKLYGHSRVFAESARPDDPDPLSMYIYPRLVIVKREDHNHAAFYPPLSRRRAKGEEFSGEIILEFVKDYLKNPKKWIVDSEHF